MLRYNLKYEYFGDMSMRLLAIDSFVDLLPFKKPWKTYIKVQMKVNRIDYVHELAALSVDDLRSIYRFGEKTVDAICYEARLHGVAIDGYEFNHLEAERKLLNHMREQLLDAEEDLKTYAKRIVASGYIEMNKRSDELLQRHTEVERRIDSFMQYLDGWRNTLTEARALERRVQKLEQNEGNTGHLRTHLE